MTWELQRWLNLFECTNGGCSGRVDGGAYIYLWAAARAMARGSKATRDMDCVHKYVQHIADVSSPKAEYVRHFEAVAPRALDGRYLLTSGSPPSHAFAEVEGSLPFLDREVQQTVETMVESLVFADKHMDNLSNHDLGVEVHDVPADGDCLLHSWVKAVDSVKNDELPLFFRSVASLREGLAQFFEAHASRLEQQFLKRHVWPWHRPFNEWINYDRPPASVAEYARFLRTPRTWLTNYELQALVTMAPKSLKCFTQNEQHGVWQQIPRFQMDEFLRAPPSRHVVKRGDISLSQHVCLQFAGAHYKALLASTSSTRMALYERAMDAQAKQAIKIKKRSLATLHPPILGVGMIVKVEGDGRIQQTNAVNKVGPMSLVCVVHSQPYNDVYQLVGTGGFLQSPRPRETLEAVPLLGGGWTTIADYAQSDGLKEQWERCKQHQPGDKGFKMIPPGTMVRDRAKHKQLVGNDVHKKNTLESFRKVWDAGTLQQDVPNTKGSKKRKAVQTIDIPRPKHLLSIVDYNIAVRVVKANKQIIAQHRDGENGKRAQTNEAICEALGVLSVSRKDRQRFWKLVDDYDLQMGVEGEEVNLMHKEEIAKGVSKWVEVLHEGTLPNALWDLHTAAAAGIPSCHSPLIMHNATKGRYCGINQEMCRAFKKCCTLCSVDVYDKAKKVRMYPNSA